MPIKLRKPKPEVIVKEALREGFDGRQLPPELFSALDKIKEAQFLPELEEANKEIKPQQGPQMLMASSDADIAIIGGAAFGGKSYQLVLEGARFVDNKDWRFTGFRRTSPELTQAGGLADVSHKVYPHVGGRALDNGLMWRFPSGAWGEFRPLEYEKDVHAWQSSQVPLFLFDELTHFTRFQFFYMLTRNRSIAGIHPYVRCALNPDPTSWVTEILAPWINKNYEGPQGKAKIAEKRYFTGSMEKDEIEWVSPDWRDIFGNRPKSITFIQAFAWDNLLGMKYNPDYLSNLLIQDYVTQQRLLWGNWEIVETGNMFRRSWFKDRIINRSQLPEKMDLVLWWDLAGVDPNKTRNKNKPDYTCAILMGKSRKDGTYWILDMILTQLGPAEVKKLVLTESPKYYKNWCGYGIVNVRMGRDPGSAGLHVIDDYEKEFRKLGIPFEGVLESGSKVDRARPLSGDCFHGNVYMLESPEWNEQWFKFACIFPKKGDKDDPVDASSGAHYCLENLQKEMGSPVDMVDRYNVLRIPKNNLLEDMGYYARR